MEELSFKESLNKFREANLNLTYVNIAFNVSIMRNINLINSDENFNNVCCFVYNVWAKSDDVDIETIACNIDYYLDDHTICQLLQKSYYDEQWFNY